MSKKYLLLIPLAVILIFMVFVVGKKIEVTSNKLIADKTENIDGKILEDKFIDENAWKEVLKAYGDWPEPAGKLAGAIVPHDLSQGVMMDRMLKRLKKSNLKTLILIGPNHYERGLKKIITSKADWRTSTGVVRSDQEMIDLMLRSGEIGVDDEVMVNDHAVLAIMPYLVKELPEVKVVPILLSGYMTETEVDSLGLLLKPLISDAVMPVACVDFSHYLNAQKAADNDLITWQVMEQRDYRKLFSFNSDFVDSPPAIALVLKITNAFEARRLIKYTNTNSGLLSGNLNTQTTSYFEIGIER
jgi:AmmeMemoRadiSam system protein B